MNIDDYRAMVAEEAQQGQEQQQQESQGVGSDAQAQQTAVVDTQTIIPEATTGDNLSQEQRAETDEQSGQVEATRQTIEIDGKEIPIDELKGGYLRQQDYTRKTQELSRERDKHAIAAKYYDAVNSDPELARTLADKHDLPYVSKEEARVKDLEQKYNDLLLRQEIELLQTKYDDFDAQSVVKVAVEKGISNLEDAYILSNAKKATATPTAKTGSNDIDIEALTEQIRQKVLSDLQSTVDTSSIIGTGGNGTQVETKEPILSQQELRVAKGMGMSAQEYRKWSK